MTDYDQLERLAREATPGPWNTLLLANGADVRAPHASGGSTWIAETRCNSDAAYIAACSPDQVLRLVSIAKAAPYACEVIEMALHYIKRDTDDSAHAAKSLAALRAALSPEKEQTE